MKNIKCIKGTKYAIKTGDIFKEYELLKKEYSHSFMGAKRYSYIAVNNLSKADLVIIKHPILNHKYTLLANRFIEIEDNPVASLDNLTKEQFCTLFYAFNNYEWSGDDPAILLDEIDNLQPLVKNFSVSDCEVKLENARETDKEQPSEL